MFTSFGDIGQHFSKICTETFKRNVHNPKRRRPRFQKLKNCFFNNWYCISQVHGLKPIIKRSFRQPVQPKRDSSFEQKTRIVSSREIWGSSRNQFFTYNQRNKPSRAQKTFLERNQRCFGKFLFCSRNKSCFYKYSISQDISNAGCKEPKYQT